MCSWSLPAEEDPCGKPIPDRLPTSRDGFSTVTWPKRKRGAAEAAAPQIVPATDLEHEMQRHFYRPRLSDRIADSPERRRTIGRNYVQPVEIGALIRAVGR